MPDVSAVTWLFVPGDRPDRFATAAAAGADAVILDLEDAVAPRHKEAARDHVVRWLGGAGTGWVRINAAGTPWYADDLATLAGCDGLRGVVVPKAEDGADLGAVGAHLGIDVGVVALVESAVGVHRAAEIAASRGVDRLAFGSIDYALDIGADGTWDSLLLARSALVIASRLAGIDPPVDGVTTALHEPEILAADVGRARGLGFTGKLCIHPAQVEAVARGFAPSADEVAWARRITAAADGAGAVAVDGAMVDRPVLERARRILAYGQQRAGGST